MNSMQPQGNSYLSKNINVSNDRYVYDNKRLGDRTLTSNTIDGKRYYSSLDAEIYFGGQDSMYMDELLQITWSVEQATLPLFGYNSYVWDDLAVGSRQVTGSFAINFISSGYLYDILRKVEPVNRASYYEHIPDAKNLNWTSQFDKEHAPAWDRSFNIIVGYGDYKRKGSGTTMTIIRCVQLTGCQQVLGVDGSPIAEVYSFIAKDIRNESSNNLPDTPPTIEEENKEEVINKFLFQCKEVSMTNITGSHDYTLPGCNYYFTLDFSCTGGTPTKIVIDLRDHKRAKLSNESIEIPINKCNGYIMDLKYMILISKMVQEQKKSGATSFYMYTDITVEYEVDGEEKQPFFIKYQKVSIS